MSDIQGYSQPTEAQFGDYVALLKPRVMSLVVFTALVGAPYFLFLLFRSIRKGGPLT